MGKKKNKKPWLPWSAIIFSPYEWFTVIEPLMVALNEIERYQSKYSRWTLELRLFKTNKKDEPVKKNTRYEINPVED